MEHFEGKEVLVKIITFLGEYKESDKLSLIEELSKATNEQTPVKEVDRRANDRIQIIKNFCRKPSCKLSNLRSFIFFYF